MNRTRSTAGYYFSWICVVCGAFALLFNPVSCALHWNVLQNKRIPSTPIRSDTAATATDCQNLCAAVAAVMGCRSVNFDSSAQSCELLSTSVVQTFPVAASGVDIYDSCEMMTAGGEFILIKISYTSMGISFRISNYFHAKQWDVILIFALILSAV